MREIDLELLKAVSWREERRVFAALGAGADANATSGKGYAALHIAARRGDVGYCRALIGAGAKVDAKSESNQTPLYWAASIGIMTTGNREETLRLLLDAGADPNARPDDGHTPLHAAAERGDASACRLLIRRGADPQALTEKGELAWALAGNEAAASQIRSAIESAAIEREVARAEGSISQKTIRRSSARSL